MGKQLAENPLLLLIVGVVAYQVAMKHLVWTAAVIIVVVLWRLMRGHNWLHHDE